MSTTTATKTALTNRLDAKVLSRILEEGYGPGAWHGSDLKAALADVSAELAFWRPAEGRHSIAEIALHHAYTVRSVWARITGQSPAPFLLEGDDWFPLEKSGKLRWPQIQSTLAAEQDRLAQAVGSLASDKGKAAGDAFELVLGIACHAIYHAGQVQLIKRLHE